MKKQTLIAFFPCLAISVFPVLFLFSHNRQELLRQELWLPLFLSAAGALAVFFLARIFTRDVFFASLVAALLMCAFWYYGFFYVRLSGLFDVEGVFWRDFPRQRTSLLVWGFVWGAIFLVAVRLKTHWHKILKPLSFTLGVLLLLQIGNLAAYELTHRRISPEHTLLSSSSEGGRCPTFTTSFPMLMQIPKLSSDFLNMTTRNFLGICVLAAFKWLQTVGATTPLHTFPCLLLLIWSIFLPVILKIRES